MTDRDRLIRDRTEVEMALETLRDCGDRPGMLEEGERALEAFVRIEAALQDCEKERDEIAVLHAEELARLRDANEARHAAEQRVKELEGFVRDARPLLGMSVRGSLGARADAILAASPPLEEPG